MCINDLGIYFVKNWDTTIHLLKHFRKLPKIFFNTFRHIWKVSMTSVWPTYPDLTRINTLRLACNWCTLLRVSFLRYLITCCELCIVFLIKESLKCVLRNFVVYQFENGKHFRHIFLQLSYIDFYICICATNLT